MNSTSNKLLQLKSFKKHTGKNLQYLVNEAYRILGNPIIIYDITGKVLAYDGSHKTFWRNFIRDGSIKEEIVELYEIESAHEIMVNHLRVAYIYNEQLNHHIIFGKIYDERDLPIACVIVVATQNPFEETDFSLVAALCKVFSNELARVPYFLNFSQSTLEQNINKLIDGEIAPTTSAYVTGYIEMIYKGLKNYLYAAVSDISPCDPTFSKLEYYKDLFRQIRPAFKYSVYSNYIVMIMSTDENTFYPKRVFNRLNRIFEQENIKIGISSRFENLFDLQIYYSQAVSALKGGLKKGGKQQVFVYDHEADPQC